MAYTQYTILITDRYGDFVGDPIVNWLSIDVTLRFNQPGSGLIELPGYGWIRDMMLPGGRIVVARHVPVEQAYQSSILLSGPIESWLYERSDDQENAGPGKITVHFADDLARIVARQVYPDPTLAAASNTTESWTFTGNAELALRAMVNLNAGPGALTARQVPGLLLGDVALVGSGVQVKTQRMQPLGDVAREIALVGGGLGFRARQSGTQIVFDVYQPADKSNQIRFGFNLGNLKYLAFETVSPTVTTAVVGAQGEGADLAVIERNNTVDEGEWGRYEKLIARPGNGPAQELQDAGDQALAEGATKRRVAANTMDTPDQTFGVHYNMGDIVSIETFPGEQLSDKVVTVHVQAWPTSGEYIQATIGSQAAVQENPVWLTVMREIEGRLNNLERVVQPLVTPGDDGGGDPGSGDPGGGDPGGGTGPLSAGADTSIPAGSALTRTATEPGVTITNRTWTIMSGPMGTGTTIGTAASISWVPGSSPDGTTDIRQPVVQEMCFEIVSTAENSTTTWTTAYSYIEDINDDRGYTGGLIGFTSGTGDMLELVQYYGQLKPTGNTLTPYISGLQACASVGMGSGASSAAASNLGTGFRNAWAAAANSDPIFRKAQRDLRKSMYWDDALQQALQDGVGPLGMVLHYDVLVNHGPGNDSESYGGIIAAARASSSKPPSQGGNESAYLTKICDLRDQVLQGWGDYQANGRSGIFRGLISAGKFSLITPFSWSVYGDSYTMSTRPTPPADAVIGTYVLRYTATGAGSDDVTITVT